MKRLSKQRIKFVWIIDGVENPKTIHYRTQVIYFDGNSADYACRKNFSYHPVAWDSKEGVWVCELHT